MKNTKNICMTVALIAAVPTLFVLLQSSEPFSGDEWMAPEAVKAKKNPVEVNEATLAAGKKSYEKECLSCHGKKGKGDGPNAATLEKPAGDLTSEKIQSQTDGELFWKITEGRKPMPSTKKIFTEEQRWQIVNYIRSFKKVKK